MEINNLQSIYEKRIVFFELKENKLRKQLILLSALRFILFILSITTIIFLVKQFSFLLLGILVLFFALFIAGVILYLMKTEVLNHFKNLIKINIDEKNVLNNDYAAFNNGTDFINRDHDYSYDLDFFGEGSLFQYLNRTVTLVGRELLAKRLLNSTKDRSGIEERQKGVRELNLKIDWRQDFIATAYSYPISKDDNTKIDYWIDQPIYYLKRIFFKTIVVILPVVTLSFLVLLIAGISSYVWFVLFGLLQLFISSVLLRRTNKEQRIVTEELRILKKYSKLIKLIESEEFSSSVLSNLQNNLKTEDGNAQSAFHKLIKIIDAFDTRLNMILGGVLNATLMWDLYSVMRLEHWKVKYGQNVKQWVKVIAEFDFYCSISNYAYNNPDFIYPSITDHVVLETEELGHPLIPRAKRVNNNFKIGNRGEIDIITGANMAGKSTFLRTVGVNLILALMGTPVCATKFNFQLMDLYTGMRTADSLKENESYFYAELKRLKIIIEKLKKEDATFILLDEILKGTNSIDKAEGSKKFVEHLIKLKATGIVATHDLTLCNLQKEYSQNIENKCFEVEIRGDKIMFDYKLQKGITQNMNASVLMNQMGIFTN